MSISVNGQSQVPPGFRFHPTEEELLQYYLKKKVGLEKIDLDVIQDVDLNKLEPWDIQEKCRIGTTPQNDWYFFSHKDKKYPTGTRTNRATCSGFWKATGRDKVIYGNSRRIGMRKTLVFYKGRAPHGQKSDWIMHEYRLDDNTNTNTYSTSATVCNGNGNGNGNGEGGQEEGWVVCRVFKKKHLGLAGHKVPDIPTWSPSSTINSSSCNEGCLEEMLQSMATPSRRDHDLLQLPDNNMTSRRFLKLPGLNSSSSCRTNCYQPLLPFQMFAGEDTPDFPPFISPPPDIQDWAALDRLVASHLNGPSDGGAKQHLSNDNIDPRMSFIVDDNDDHHQMLNSQQQQQQQQRSSSSSRRYGVGGAQDYQNEGDLWGFAPTSNDQICDVSSVHPI